MESSKKTPALPGLLFIFRNGVLLLLLINGYLHFKGILNPFFLTAVFVVSVLGSLFMYIARLRLAVAFCCFFLVMLAWRTLTFLIFKVSQNPAVISDADFLFFFFDKDFIPALVPAFIAWLFNLLALRYKHFIFLEVGLNSLLLLAVFITEVNYNITLYHPTVFAGVLILFLFLEIIILLLHWLIHYAPDKKGKLSPVYLLFLLPLLLIFFLYSVLMENYNRESVKSRGGLMESTLFRFDFSRYIRLESEIKLSDDLVMLMRKNGPAARILIRRFVLSGYEPARGFYQSKGKDFDEIPVIVPDNTLTLADPRYTERETVEQEYFFVNLDPTSLVAMNYPVKIVPLKNWDTSSFLRIYRVSSRVSQVDPESLRVEETPGMDKEQLRFYTENADDEVIRDLALEITTGLETYTDKVIAIKEYLRQNYAYSLKPGLATDSDQLHHFLFKSKKGYCSYFAFAMALLCRSIGIPARVAVGFASQPEWEELNFYEIRANLAHAWVEVYFGNYGWIEFDPTSSNIAEGEDISFLMGFDVSDELKKLITEILNNQDKLEEAEEEEAQNKRQLTDSLDALLKNFNSFIARTWYFILPGCYILLLAIIKLRSYLLYLLAAKPASRAKYLYRHSLVWLYNLGRIKKRDESFSEYAVRMETDYRLKFTDWTASYLKAVFAEHFSGQDLAAHQAVYAEVLAVYRTRVPLPLRIVAFFNPVHSLRSRST